MITPELLKDVPLFAEVPHAELSTIAGRAADVDLREGEWLIHEGETPAFFIVLSGKLEVWKSFGGTERMIVSEGKVVPPEYGLEQFNEMLALRNKRPKMAAPMVPLPPGYNK